MTKVWFPNYYTEAHRTKDAGVGLVKFLSKYGYECVPFLDIDCRLAFCGSIYTSRYVVEARNHNKIASRKVVHYSWDIYPFQVQGDDKRRWAEYLSELRLSDRILVPSECSITRVGEFVSREAIEKTHVTLASIRPWGIPDRKPRLSLPEPRTYVLDVMRKYLDPNRDILREVCDNLNIPLIQTETRTEWDEFRWLVGNAKLLVSPNYEASTGGLTLLEGYWHGVPVLLSDSPRNGSVDYFGDRAYYFRWDDKNDLTSKLRELYNGVAVVPDDHKKWVEENYSEEMFAKRLAYQFDEVLR